MRKIWVVFFAILTFQLGIALPATAERSTCTCYYGYDEECPKDFVCEGNFTGADKCIRMKGPGATRKEQKGGAWRKDGKGCTLQDGDGDADLRGNECAVQSGNRCVEAITAGLTDPNAVAGIIDSIVAICAGRIPFGNTGLEGFPPVEGVKVRIQDTVEFLTTPPAVQPIPKILTGRVRPLRSGAP